MKKTKGKNSKKITDFFQAEQKEQKNEDSNEKNDIDLLEDGDLDLFYIDQERTKKMKTRLRIRRKK
jgi:hypothetical protein